MLDGIAVGFMTLDSCRVILAIIGAAISIILWPAKWAFNSYKRYMQDAIASTIIPLLEDARKEMLDINRTATNAAEDAKHAAQDARSAAFDAKNAAFDTRDTMLKIQIANLEKKLA